MSAGECMWRYMLYLPAYQPNWFESSPFSNMSTLKLFALHNGDEYLRHVLFLLKLFYDKLQLLSWVHYCTRISEMSSRWPIKGVWLHLSVQLKLHCCCKGLHGAIKWDVEWHFLNAWLMCIALFWLDGVLTSVAACDEHSPKLECVESAALRASVPPQCAIFTHPNQPMHIPTNAQIYFVWSQTHLYRAWQIVNSSGVRDRRLG